MKPRWRDRDQRDGQRDNGGRPERRRRRRRKFRDERHASRPEEPRREQRPPPHRERERKRAPAPAREPERAQLHPHPPATRRSSFIVFAIGIGAVLVLLLFVLGLHHRHAVADADERRTREQELMLGPQILVATATKAPATRKIVLPGDVRPWRLAVVYARVSGYLAELFVDRGDRVADNQVLGRVTTPETEFQLRPLEANLRTKQAIANRLRPLVPKGLVSQQDLDAADADVQAAQSDVDRLRAFKGFEAIRAPFGGVVTQRYVDIGALMPAPTAATQSAQPLVDIADIAVVRVVIYVGQRDATGIHVGDRVSIARDDDPTRPIAAKVSRIPIDLDLRTRTMWVEADVDNADNRLYPGSFVTVTLDVPAPAGVIIPSDAIALVQGNPSVALIASGIAHFVPITVADDDGKVARVVAGVHAGDQIAARITDELRDGGRVRTKPVPEPGVGSGSGGPQ